MQVNYKNDIEKFDDTIAELRTKLTEKESVNLTLLGREAALEKCLKEYKTAINEAEDAKDQIESELKAAQKNLMTERLKTKEDRKKSKSENTQMFNKNQLKKLEETIVELKKNLTEKESDNESLLNRLSAVTAAQVLYSNPNVADLSDPNRPQKLSDHMSQLYDDQWTDATEELDNLHIDDDDVPKILLRILILVYGHCKASAENQLSRIRDDIFLPPLENQLILNSDNSKEKSRTSPKPHPQITEKGENNPELPVEVKKGIKDFRKKVTKQAITAIEREITNKLRHDPEIGEEVVDACQPFVSRCVELCWLMRVQDPPVALSWTIPEDKSFCEDVYRAYTQSGSYVEYVVWPTVYLYEGGPMLTKGVAQGVNKI